MAVSFFEHFTFLYEILTNLLVLYNILQLCWQGTLSAAIGVGDQLIGGGGESGGILF